MTLHDVVAALVLIEDLRERDARERCEEAAQEATERFAAIIGGSGYYHRFQLFKQGNGFRMVLLRWSLCGPTDERETLQRCDALGIESR